MRRAVPILAAALAVLAVGAGDAGATGECDGLDVCISVAGPWVAVPAPAGPARLQRVEYQLSCPRGTIAGGLDAVFGDRTLDVVFLGALGSPVNPGITTSRSVVFVATHTRRAPTHFRPLLGCIPTSGGGRETTGVAAPAPQPPVRRVRTVALRADAVQTVVVRCGAGERLVSSSHAIGFRTQSAPTARVLTAVSVTRRERADRVEVRARRGLAVPVRTRVEVQVHALCARSA
jgi:hypothetical protein